MDRAASHHYAEAETVPIGTTIGEPLTGSGMMIASRPNASRIRSAVITSAGAPLATIRPSAIDDEFVGVAGGQVEVVQHHDDRRAAAPVEVGEQVEHVELVAHVEERRRLVQQQDVGLLGQRHRDPHALALAAGELVDRPVGQVRVVSVTVSASATASSSSAVHWRNQRWCG